MPFQCEHGKYLDWGDFGGDPPAEPEACEVCDRKFDPDVAEFDAAMELMKVFQFDGQFAVEVVRAVRPFFVHQSAGVEGA